MKSFTYLTSDGEESVAFEVASGTLTVGQESYPCDGRSVTIAGRRVPFWTHQQGDKVSVWLDGEVFSFTVKDPRQRSGGGGLSAASSGLVAAQMPGKILSLAVQPGDRVSAGQNLLVMESMKMELALDAPLDGVVAGLSVSVGQMVAQGDELVRIEPASSDETAPDA